MPWTIRLAVLLASLAACVSAGRAGDGSDVTLGWSLIGATDDYSEGITTTGHEPYAEGRVTLGFGLFRTEAALWTEGDEPDAAGSLLVGMTPSLGDVAFDVSLERTIAPDEPDAEQWVADANATFAAADGVEVTIGASRTLPDEGGAYTDVYAGVEVTLPNDWVAAAEVTFEPDDGSGARYLQAVVGLAIPLPRDFELSGELAAEMTSDGTPDYLHWNAGVSWTGMPGVAFDLRYHGNTITAKNCAMLTDYDCDQRVIASVSYSGDYSPAGE
jgi:hypothetical protein